MEERAIGGVVMERMDIEFEKTIYELTKPVNGQYPRPWMTDSTHPRRARVFVVGRNQATVFPVDRVRVHSRFIDSLYNRNGESCLAMYREMRGDRPDSPTRKNIARFTAMLRARAIEDVLETNIVCYSTKMSAELSREENKLGRERGQQIFTTLLQWIRPQVMIVQGAGTRNDLEKTLGVALPEARKEPGPPVIERLGDLPWMPDWRPNVFLVGSLAPPGWNKWQRWAEGHLAQVADEVARLLS